MPHFQFQIRPRKQMEREEKMMYLCVSSTLNYIIIISIKLSSHPILYVLIIDKTS